MKRLAWTLLFLVTATPLAAHPHIFVDTGLEIIFDDAGQMTHVRVTWQYDEPYSLLITEDMELDQDFDGVLTPDEQARLTGFDMQWIEGYKGDLELLDGAQPVALSGPLEFTGSFEGGRVTTTHLRALLTPVSAQDAVVIKPYDPTFYTAYDVTLPVTVTGAAGCTTRVKMPDMTAALKDLQEELAALDPDSDPEDAGLPNIGAQLANDVIVTCERSWR